MSIIGRVRIPHGRNFFLDLFRLISRTWDKAGEVKNDPEKAKTFKKYGILGIVWATLAVALMIPVGFAAFYLFQLSFSNLGVFTYIIFLGNIVLFFVALFLIFIPFLFSVYSIAYPIAQMRVNKNFISWFSLFYCIIMILGLFVLALLVFTGTLGLVKA